MSSRLLPFFGFVLVFALLGFGIYWSQRHDPREVPSPLIGKPAPQFSLPVLGDPSKQVGTKELAGQPYLLNVFASWCFACREEHSILMNDGKFVKTQTNTAVGNAVLAALTVVGSLMALVVIPLDILGG